MAGDASGRRRGSRADAYTAHMVRLAGEINVLLATVLGLPEDYFTTRARQATRT
ncbi:hypothetical protein GCM10022420_008490 [Streptomyces iranensis]